MKKSILRTLFCTVAIASAMLHAAWAGSDIEPGRMIEPTMIRSDAPYRHWTITLAKLAPDSPSTKQREEPSDLTLHLVTRLAGCAARSPIGQREELARFRSGRGRGRCLEADRDADTARQCPWREESRHVACFDAATGERLWEAVYSLGGRTFQVGKLNLINSTMAVADDFAVAVGGTGRVYCLDAQTGRQRWQAFLPYHEDATVAAARGRPAGGRARPHAVTIVAGKAVVADERGGLVAFDLEDGTLAWHAQRVLGNQATPNVWSDGQTTLILSQFDRDEGNPIHALDPQTGEQVWKIQGLADHPYKMASNFLMGDVLITLDDAKVDDGENGAGKRASAVTAYRISADRGEKIWQLPAGKYRINAHLGQGAMAALDDHRVVMYSTWHRTPSGMPYMWIVDTRNGKVVWEDLKPQQHVDWGGSGDFVSCGDRLIKQVDPSHQRQQYHGYQITESGLRRLWTSQRFGPMEATSYEVPLVNPFVDGRLIVRHAFGIYCYDLRER